MSKFDKKLLKILACPKAVHMKSKTKDPGALRLYQNDWLISDISGYKYPIIDGVPILLSDVGKKWAKTKEKDLPVPAPKQY